MSNQKRVRILGSGRVGQPLGRGFAKHGDAVTVGPREPTRLGPWRKETAGTGIPDLRVP